MKIKIEFMGSLRRPKNMDRKTTIEIADDSSLKDLLKILEYTEVEIRRVQTFHKDGTRVELHDQFKEGDYLFLTIPIGGGLQS